MNIKITREHIRKFFKAAVGIIIAVTVLIKIGIITPPMTVMEWHFNQNKESFQSIAKLIYDFDDSPDDEDFWQNEKLDKWDYIKLRVLGNYEYIDGSKYDNTVRFVIANFVPRTGEPTAIIYSPVKPKAEEYYDGDKLKYVNDYKELGDNWYLEYRRSWYDPYTDPFYNT